MTEKDRQSQLDGKALNLLHQSGAIRKITVLVGSPPIAVLYSLKNGVHGSVYTTQGKLKRWATLDATFKWLNSIGISMATIKFTRWLPKIYEINDEENSNDRLH